MKGNAKIGVALAGGYLLGRTKKAKMAIGLGMFLAGKKLSLDPAQLGRLVADSPALGRLNGQVRKELVEATKSAATSALTQRATGLADSLQKRTRALDEPDDRDGPSDRDESDDREETDDSAGEKTSSGARRARNTSGRARKSASAAGKSTSGTRKAASRTRTTKTRGGRDE
ncbi:hypothetical protein AB0M87_15990 [Streptomyces sp. NPDC051320]|uniref:hypothetical protein n=1 Tax=Streptomyces sp. NPDC051320 TaxID=3154644 RepID=UPI00341418CC